MAVQTQIQARRGTAATWTSTNPTLAAGETGFETDTGKFKIGTGSLAWNSLAYAGGATAVTYLFNATAGQTTFSGADANGLTLAYTVGAEQVYLNGVLQVRGSDYTATNGTSIVLASGALVSDVLNVIAYSAMTITDTYTQAQADAKFVQQTNNFFAGKNKIINGDFGVWQRGTSFNIATATGSFAADRFTTYSEFSSGSITVSQQTFTPATAPVSGYEGQYYLRWAQTSTSGGTNPTSGIAQNIENVRTFAGQTVTVSFWAKADASRTVTTAYEQYCGTGGSGYISGSIGSYSVTTSWQRFTTTFTVPSLSGKTLGANSRLQINWSFPINTTATIDIWGIQLEAGSIATPFQTATGTIQGELAACQRYYWRSSSNSANNWYATGVGYSTTEGLMFVQMPVQMRVAPTVLDYSSLIIKDSGTSFSFSGFSINQSGASSVVLYSTGSTGLTQYRPYFLANNNTTSGYFGLGAEL